jgi:hypothetical protein
MLGGEDRTFEIAEIKREVWTSAPSPDDRHRRAGGEEQRRDPEEGLLGSSLGKHAS